MQKPILRMLLGSGLVLFSVLYCIAVARAEMCFIAHRGESADAPENTLAAFQLAIERGVDGFECDVWLTKDKRIACIHDNNTKRVTGNKTNLLVTTSTLAELRALDVGSWKGPSWAGAQIPTLEEVLALAHDGFRIYVEIKEEASSGVIPYIVAAVQAEFKATPDRIVFISFKESSVTAIRAALPDYQAFWLSTYSAHTNNLLGLVDRLQIMNATGFSGQYGGGIISNAVTTLHAAGLSAHVWTVDKPELAISCAEFGINSLTSNSARQMTDNVFGEAVPHDWLDFYPDLMARYASNYRAAAMSTTGKLDARSRDMRVWEDFLAGTCPTNHESRLRCYFSNDSTPQVSWMPNLGSARCYTVYGKTNLTDLAWITPINDATRFFKVGVRFP